MLEISYTFIIELVTEKVFYQGFQYKYELAHKIVCCLIQVAEVLEHSHANGVLHMNLHPGNILVPRCGDRNQQIGFFVTDFGDPLILTEDSLWTDLHEKTFSKLTHF